MVRIIDGKGIAQGIIKELKAEVDEIKKTYLITPKLSVVLVGEDPASQIYVRNKEKACEEIGIISETIKVNADTKQTELIEIINQLNKDLSVHGILIQMPLPKGLNEYRAILAISQEKDVDGLHPLNLGNLLKGEGNFFVPCTPKGIMELIQSTGREIKGREAVVIGRSNLVGKPAAILLMHKHATVTICHSRTIDLAGAINRADIVIAAVGSPGMIRGDWIKEGAIVIDVGINRVEKKIVGDVEFERASEKASFITPVPRGVGPMTIAMLLKNTLQAAMLSIGKNS